MRSVRVEKNLTEDAKMHYYLKDGQLEVRFCASGATIQVKPKEKHLQIEVPKNMQLSIHSTSADVKAIGKGLQKGLSYVPSTYGTSMLKNHMLRGVFEEMKSKGFPTM